MELAAALQPRHCDQTIKAKNRASLRLLWAASVGTKDRDVCPDMYLHATI
jgi:hypothetical protein